MSANPCRLLIDPPAKGARNMAADDVLLESAAEHSTCTLRLYSWSEPTLSLGYFQRYAERELHPASIACALVRRATGGGAILHDQELTYSLAVPRNALLVRDACGLYRAVHQAVIGALVDLGVSGDLLLSDGSPQDRPFLCFARRSVGDVLLGGAKVCGSAQRRTRGAILQHGSVLLRRSPHAFELPGIEEQTGRRIAVNDLAQPLKLRIAQALGLEMVPGTLSEAEQAAIASVTSDRYSSASWTRRR